MKIITHKMIDQKFSGKPIAVKNGFSQVELAATGEMAVDESGLVHGGFLFGLADYAAMIAVNHPNVVLGAAEVKFLKPATVGDTVSATAFVDQKTGKKQMVRVAVACNGETIFKGMFTCFVLDKHVLD